ncbi:multicopper oxidase 4 [Glossina fuscipes fuscipes]
MKNSNLMRVIRTLLWLISLKLTEECLTQSLSRYAQILNLYPRFSLNSTSSPNYHVDNHPCKRTCLGPEHAMTCYYYLIVHYDETMGPACEPYLNRKYHYKVDKYTYIDPFSVQEEEFQDDESKVNHCKYADGIESEIMVVNGQLPGETIEVCYGDTIVTDVLNTMHETTSIHWHGIHHYKTPYMDGVPFITQYPIEPGQAFRYRFETDHAGTHWWHSHTEHQRAFGLAGALIIRQTLEENPHAKLYDFDLTEHTIMIQDWLRDFDESTPKTILINGLGEASDEDKPILYSRFTVEQRRRYRFRVIFNGVTNCPVSLSIDQHDLLVIASDGNDIEPLKVQQIMFHGGERYDFVLHANRRVKNYWLRIKGFAFCSMNKLQQKAILHYKKADRIDIPADRKKDHESLIEFNGFNVTQDAKGKRFSLMDVNALETKADKLPQKPDQTLYISMNVVPRGESKLFQLDDISFIMPNVSLLQARKLGVGKSFCNITMLTAKGFNCEKRLCQCTNVLHLPAFKHIELVVTSKSDAAHPIHLHGYTFRVVGMGYLGPDNILKIEEIDRKQPLPRRLMNAPLKDTVQVPGHGYTIIRLFTDNPGYWFLHCHISTHGENGMLAVLRIGGDDEMKLCPLSNCGLCNSVA